MHQIQIIRNFNLYNIEVCYLGIGTLLKSWSKSNVSLVTLSNSRVIGTDKKLCFTYFWSFSTQIEFRFSIKFKYRYLSSDIL